MDVSQRGHPATFVQLGDPLETGPMVSNNKQPVPQLEKLSVSVELSGNNWKNQLSNTEKKKIFQIARIIILQQSKDSPREKFRSNLEKSIENHMKRMASRTGKNIRIIKPPPTGLKVLRNGEWVIPKNELRSFRNCVERAKQLISQQIPMTIPDIEPIGVKRSEKRKTNLKKKKPKLDSLSNKLKTGVLLSDAEQILLFKKMFGKFMKKRKEFIDSVKDLQDHLEDIRFEDSATHLISKTISSLSQIDNSSATPTRKVRKKTTIKKMKRAPDISSSSYPMLVRKPKPKIIVRKISEHRF